ncbi:MAG: ribonuclease J [Lachnospirales bacterium]
MNITREKITKGKLRVIPLGGLHEIGKNITVLEYKNDIIIIDCGIAFPSDNMLGIDLVAPDFTYLEKNESKIRGLFLTHGHEDHIGAIPYLLRKINIPIYGTNLTLGLVSNKLKEHSIEADLNIVSAGDKIRQGCFQIEFIGVNHSIVDACALAITTPVGVIVHSGDFKIDFTPIDGKIIDLKRFAELGKKGVLLFLCESTNIESEGYTMSERTVGKIFQSTFENSDNQRIMVATFSSNIHRIQQIINYATLHNRKVAILGRSMVNNIRTACELGYLDVPDNIVISNHEIKNYADEDLVIITTGSQGEPMAALSRMANSEHKQVEVKPGDKIIISATPIPGNEKTVSKVVNDLMLKGAEVIYEAKMDIHVSGHAKKEEIKVLHTLISPKYVMPVHGEYRHLKLHKDLAMELGTPKENIFTMANGDILEVNKKSAEVNGAVTAGQVLIDGLGIGDVGNIVLRDRKRLAEDGLMVVVIGIDKATGEFTSGPDLISRGFVYVRESEALMDEAREVISQSLVDLEGKNDWSAIKTRVREVTREYLWQQTKRNPMVLPVIVENNL